jgi:hypothetical protein
MNEPEQGDLLGRIAWAVAGGMPRRPGRLVRIGDLHRWLSAAPRERLA